MARHTVLRSPRLARRARKRTGQRIAFIISALVFLLGAVLFVLTREPFSIREVVVSGVSEELDGAITETARAELAGAYFSLLPKRNVFAYPKNEIEEKILEKFPRVEKARAHLFSPSRLEIDIREREGVALWCVSRASDGGDDCLRIDASGVVFEEASSPADFEYRVRDGGAKGSVLPSLGTRVLPPERLSALLSFLRSLEALSLSPSRLTLLFGGDVSAEIAGSGRILAREGGDFLKQADHLRGLLAEGDLVPRSGEKLNIEYIDLRHGNKIYFKPR